MDTKIALPWSAKLINVTETQGKYIIDRDGRLALSIDLEEATNRYNAIVLLDGTWTSQWFDSFGPSAQSDNVFDLAVDDVQVEFSSSTRGSIRESSPGTLAVTDKGVMLLGKPYGDEASGPPVPVALHTRKRAERCNDIAHILSGWVIRGYREKTLAFEFHQPAA
jgi:hypothetical protein